MATDPRHEYALRMHRVLAHVDEHLDGPLDLAQLAAVAHFSPYHFHRLFTAWMGETLGDYLRRRRMEVAALRLLTQPSSSVLDIALAVGFGSGEAFARAFKKRFGCSASQWRVHKAAEREAQIRNLGQAMSKFDQVRQAAGNEDAGLLSTPEEHLMNVSVVDRQPVRVAYLRYVGPYGPAVHQFWQQHFYPFMHRHQLLGRHIYGISHDDPDIAAPETCRYDTCVEVDGSFVAPPGAHVGTIAGGLCASLPFKGTSAEIVAAWKSLMRDWLPQSGYQLDNRPTFEHYPPDAVYDQATGAFKCNIVIPLVPL